MDDGLLKTEADGTYDGDSVAGIVDVMQIGLCSS